jgi:hypothetical protein
MSRRTKSSPLNTVRFEDGSLFVRLNAMALVGMAAGAKGYLSKPVSVMKFLEAVRGIIG